MNTYVCMYVHAIVCMSLVAKLLLLTVCYLQESQGELRQARVVYVCMYVNSQ